MADLIPNYAPGPDGVSMASLLTGSQNLRLWQVFEIPEAGDYTLSAFVAGNGGGAIVMSLGEHGEYSFNPDTQVGTGSGEFEAIGVSGWFKVSITRPLSVGTAIVSFRAGDNKAAGVLIFGGSLSREAGAYIPTNANPETITDYEASPKGTVTFAVTPDAGNALLWEGDYQYFISDLDVTHEDLYIDIRRFLLGLFPEAARQVIKSMQNNQPLPENAIVMNMLFEHNLNEAVTDYGLETEAYVTNSVEARLQLDFYGIDAQRRSRIVYNLWKNYYATDRLKVCQPLYVQSYNRHPYVNDSNKYEDRWILDLALNYLPRVTHYQDFAEEAKVTIKTEPNI